jgi:cobalt-zinc-cadmium efflux system protein
MSEYHTGAGTGGGSIRYLVVALGLIVAFMVGEATAAAIGGSLVLFADAGHMLTDAAALAASVWAARLATRPPRAGWTFGLKRAEVLSAAVNGISLLAVGVVIVAEGIQRLLTPPAVAGGLVLGVALVGAVVNVAATLVLARADQSSINVRGAFAHILTDLYAFAGTAIAGLVLLLTGWSRADALGSLVIAVLMFRAAWPLLRDSGRILLQGAPEEVSLDEVRRHLCEVDHVVDVHDLHAWTVTSGEPVLSAHVVLQDRCFGDGHAPQVLDSVQACLAGHFDIAHSTFQFEPSSHAGHEGSQHG